MKTTASLFCSIFMVIISLVALVTVMAHPAPAGIGSWVGPVASNGLAALAAYNGARLIRKARGDENL